MNSIEVGVLGATGMVGQHFIRFLDNHPWFHLTWAGASDRSAGKLLRDASPWRLEGEMPSRAADLRVVECKPGSAPPLLFSAMDASVATEIERDFAAAGHIVVSNSRNHRLEPDVPLLVPEVNPDHLAAIPVQRKLRGWKGAIVTNPNCSTIVLTLALAPFKQFGIERVLACTMQAVSGAGYPGVSSFDILGNVIPFIGGEEEKMQVETQKILGCFSDKAFAPLPARVSAHCNRVPSVDGHVVAASVAFGRPPSVSEAIEALQHFRAAPQKKKLPSAPEQPIVYLPGEDRPQPRRDAGRAGGMSVSVGRVRECPVFDLKFVACGHNTIRGAAGAAVLNAELLMSEGFLSSPRV